MEEECAGLLPDSASSCRFLPERVCRTEPEPAGAARSAPLPAGAFWGLPESDDMHIGLKSGLTTGAMDYENREK